MRDLWLKTSCFFTGFNYQIVKNSSEAAAKMVKKNMSALIIISILWAFIGFNFTSRYLHGNTLTSLIVALVMVVVVIQIERQILLNVTNSKGAITFRTIIGVIMAFIGSIIIDQIIFKDDIEQGQMATVQQRVNRILPMKTTELKEQIAQIANAIESKEAERNQILVELGKNPTISTPTSVGKYEKDSTGKMVMVGREVTYQSVPNPKASLIPQIDDQLAQLRTDLAKKEELLLNIRSEIEKEMQSKTGFLDELTALYKIATSSFVSIFVWMLFFLFFASMELFILVNKISDNHTDYEDIIMHQMRVRMKQLEKLSETV
ncbi:DUF4407 domain-containing protein [Tenuifilum thalassicum]|uniref:DUF4407 domain-containing protein n=1 Tax=Tenuifilum thalassicum TaxID=2590900 RepID=A0A7D3XDR1_9BACT|nr:DUF4407 domain-containing protein [Tenuifilum thalassicum]QKG79307.1 DUF4407 domain-containing protein [Tenuifilum thalassicum]